MSEMISWNAVAVFVTVCWAVWMVWGVVFKVNKPKVEKREPRDLSALQTRESLTRFLQQNSIYGNAEIRNGMVFAPVSPERLEPLAIVLNRADDMISMLRNPAADVLYVMEDGRPRLTGIDLSDVREAASVMRRVAEDRKKSRSLYKGHTDDELKAVVRAGLSQWHKDHGDFDYSNKVMAGDFDDDRSFAQAMAVLDLLFKVKGVRVD